MYSSRERTVVKGQFEEVVQSEEEIREEEEEEGEEEGERELEFNAKIGECVDEVANKVVLEKRLEGEEGEWGVVVEVSQESDDAM